MQADRRYRQAMHPLFAVLQEGSARPHSSRTDMVTTP